MTERRCKVCDHTSGVDGHHEIPQAYGGTNGPVTDLCSGHHSLIHNLALQLYRGRDESKLIIPKDVPVKNHNEVLRLVRTIVIARDNYEKAKSKGLAPRKGSALKIDGKRMTRVDALVKILGGSQRDVVHMAIDRLYQSLVSKEAVKPN